MKTKLATLAAAMLALSACEVEKTQSGDMPSVDVDVSAESGNLPSYDVDWASVDVGTTTEMVEVPSLVVVMEETEVEVPYMDINLPGEDGEKVKRTVVVEAEIEGQMHELEITNVFAKDRRLIVVSTLKPTGQALQDERVRVSDRLVLNAPDLEIQHYIVGKKPDGDWNNQYVFVNSQSELRNKIKGSKEIYTK